jgi:hypothetical protein
MVLSPTQFMCIYNISAVVVVVVAVDVAVLKGPAIAMP